MGQWSDLPRRLLTVSIGAPLVIIIISNVTLSHIFFQGVHLCCIVEWLQLEPILGNDSNLRSNAAKTSGANKNDADLRENKTTCPSQIKCTCLRVFPFMSLLTVYIPSENISAYIVTVASAIFLSAHVDMMLCSPAGRTRVQSAAAHTIHGLLFLSIPFHYWILLSRSSFSHTIYLLFTVWNTDTGALVAGRLGKMCFSSQDVVGNFISKSKVGSKIVRHINRISPSKSLTGFCGGIALGIVTACIMPDIIIGVFGSRNIHGPLKDYCSMCKHIDVDLIPNSVARNGLLDFDKFRCIEDVTVRRMFIGFMVSWLAIVGDLVESCVKRNAGKKDSGKLLPGHGGILDRFDSTFLAVPIYYVLFLQ